VSQRAIDLLPDSIRARGQARQRTGRYVGWSIGALLVLVVLATHARVTARHAGLRLERAEARAARALELEEEAARLQTRLDRAHTQWERYELIALPVDLSRIMATVINRMPDTMSLDDFNVNARRRRSARGARSIGGEGKVVPARILTAELAGFAPSDETIAEYVEALSASSFFQDISLDYSRARVVRERPAREFRLSFRVDLDVPFDVRSTDETTLTVLEADDGDHAR
jgi:hypothetical protein